MSVNIFLDKARNLTNILLESFPDKEYEKIHNEVVYFLSRYSEKICDFKVNKIDEIEDINDSLFWEIYFETNFEEILSPPNLSKGYKISQIEASLNTGYISTGIFNTNEKDIVKKQIINLERSIENLRNSLESLLKDETTYIVQDIILSYIEDVISDQIYSNIMSRNIFEP